MPKRSDISHVLVIGSGPIVIGQACEFDYSGTQACRVLRAEGLRVTLVNSNPATIMTDPEFADATYVEPMTPEFVEHVIARDRPDALPASPVHEVLIEESVLGWKEYELELMRDRDDNVVVVCSIENVDPMGVHTGDSVTVAPAMTLTDREYQRMRDLGIAVVRAVGVDTGGCNIQFAVHPGTGRMVVIEMNPRVSRSSALASKATGFPIAKIAARLAIGYTLDEIRNDITGQTPACFEPALDYVVVKVPRFAFEKFPGANPALTTHMKSVGEAMAIGRSFPEALGKALRSLESPGAPLHWRGPPGDAAALLAAAAVPHDGRLSTVHQALRAGASTAEVAAATDIDPWFIDQVASVEEHAERLAAGWPAAPDTLRAAKRAGLSDAQIAEIAGPDEDAVRRRRHELGIRPVFHTVDTCAAE